MTDYPVDLILFNGEPVFDRARIIKWLINQSHVGSTYMTDYTERYQAGKPKQNGYPYIDARVNYYYQRMLQGLIWRMDAEYAKSVFGSVCASAIQIADKKIDSVLNKQARLLAQFQKKVSFTSKLGAARAPGRRQLVEE